VEHLYTLFKTSIFGEIFTIFWIVMSLCYVLLWLIPHPTVTVTNFWIHGMNICVCNVHTCGCVCITLQCGNIGAIWGKFALDGKINWNNYERLTAFPTNKLTKLFFSDQQWCRNSHEDFSAKSDYFNTQFAEINHNFQVRKTGNMHDFSENIKQTWLGRFRKHDCIIS
jgi:hypothetical protein